MVFLVAALDMADRSAPVAAGIVETMQLSAFIARDDDRTPPDLGAVEIVRPGDLEFRANIDPAAFENVLKFKLEQRLVTEQVAVNPKHAAIRVVPDIVRRIAKPHRQSL